MNELKAITDTLNATMPKYPPIVGTAVAFLVLDRLNAEPDLRGVVTAITILIWIGWVIASTHRLVDAIVDTIIAETSEAIDQEIKK